MSFVSHKTHAMQGTALGFFYSIYTIYWKNKRIIYYEDLIFFISVVQFSLALSGCELLCLRSHLVLKELSFEQRVNSKELAFTWLSRCCYGREARQRKKKPPSLRLSLIPIFILSIYIPLPQLPRSLALPESLPACLPGWKSK